MRKKLFLYGYNNRAKNVYEKLKDIQDLDISFVDKNISDAGRNIFGLHELKNMQNKDKAVVYICMQNAMQHEIAAEDLYAMGFKKIVFLPVSARYNDQAYKMVRLWNEIYQQGYEALGDVPSYEALLAEHECTSGKIIKVPMELVFVYDIGDVLKKYTNRHISLLKPYNELYRFIYAGGNEPKEYLRHFLYSGWSDEGKVIRDRIKLYEALSARMKNDSLYYSSLSCFAKVEHGKFYLLDGHHRANLAYNLGKDFLPVIVEDGIGDGDYLSNFYRGRNYKLFRALSDIVLASPEESRFNIVSDKDRELLEKYMLLLLGDVARFNVASVADEVAAGDIQVAFFQEECGYKGEICIGAHSPIDKSLLKKTYLIDNCIYKIKVMEL